MKIHSYEDGMQKYEGLQCIIPSYEPPEYEEVQVLTTSYSKTTCTID